MEAARSAVRGMIDHLVDRRGLSRQDAYVLCSLAADLKITEVVDAPNWIVGCFLPDAVFAATELERRGCLLLAANAAGYRASLHRLAARRRRNSRTRRFNA